MKKLHFLFITLIILSCSSIKIEDRAIHKLSNDQNSIEVYKTLCELKENQNGNTSYDMYLGLYNKGIPLVRLFEYETIINSYKSQSCETVELKIDYLNLVSNKFNYINDERRIEYIKEFMKNYYIIPPTN